MYPRFEEFQETREPISNERRFSRMRALPERREEGAEADATRHEMEEDLRIMQHFARDFVERSESADNVN